MDEVDFGADQMPASLQQSTDLNAPHYATCLHNPVLQAQFRSTCEQFRLLAPSNARVVGRCRAYAKRCCSDHAATFEAILQQARSRQAIAGPCFSSVAYELPGR